MADPLAEESTPGFLLPGAGAASALSVLLLGSLSGASPVAVTLATATLIVAGVRLALSLGSFVDLNHFKEVNDSLDRSFLTTLERQSNSRALVQATIELAHALGLNVVAEGVEEADTLSTLASLGCDLAQGYYLGRPTAATELTLTQDRVA